MGDLLTTRDVQDRLQVDRTTIYRMVEAGELPALRVGKQWRFPREDFERWLRSRQSGNGEQGAGPASVVAAESPKAERADNLRDMLPLECVQLIQDVFAETLGVMLVVTDMDGECVTQVSHPCGFFSAAHANTAARAICANTYRQLAATISLEPRFTSSELGLLCTRGLIRTGAELKGVLVAGGIAPDDWPLPSEHISRLAQSVGVEPGLLLVHADEVYRLDKPARDQVLRSIQRIADVFSHIAEDRSVLFGRLRSIASLATI